jgi:hypothetical protein
MKSYFMTGGSIALIVVDKKTTPALVLSLDHEYTDICQFPNNQDSAFATFGFSKIHVFKIGSALQTKGILDFQSCYLPVQYAKKM